MIINGQKLLRAAPLSPMLATKERAHGTSYGLAEAGADIRVKQTVRFVPPDPLAFFNVMAAGKGLIARDVHALEAFHGFGCWRFHAGPACVWGRGAAES